MIKFFTLLTLIVLTTVVSFAQPGDPGGGVKPGDVPITGIELLIGLGALWGGRKVYKNSVRKND
jgi:hypothetical protein